MILQYPKGGRRYPVFRVTEICPCVAFKGALENPTFAQLRTRIVAAKVDAAGRQADLRGPRKRKCSEYKND
jgi:hypothetical protein